MNQINIFSFPTPIYFGSDARKKVAEVLNKNSIKRPLIITDRGIVELEFFKDFQKDLSAFQCSTFFDFAGNPYLSHVTAGAKAYKAHQADSIIVIGGGAAMDVAKCVGIMITHDGSLFDYEDGKPAGDNISKIPFLVALPTTAGTGSEVGRCAVIADDDTKEKKLMCSPNLLPRFVFADPDLTLGLPAKITAATGMDALTHAVEAFLAKAYHPICDGIALEAIRLIAGGALVAAVRDPMNKQARADMMLASLMGAVAFQKGLGLTHSLAHPLSSVCDLHHGLANSLTLEVAMEFNVQAVPEKFKRLAAVLGKNTASEFISWVHQLRQDCGLPMSLKEAGVGPQHLESLCDFAIKDFCLGSNPRAATREDIKTLYLKAMG